MHAQRRTLRTTYLRQMSLGVCIQREEGGPWASRASPRFCVAVFIPLTLPNQKSKGFAHLASQASQTTGTGCLRSRILASGMVHSL
jgi:hypothetical protein